MSPLQSQSTRLLVWASTIIAVVTLMVAGGALVTSNQGRASSNEVRRLAEILSCRSELRVQVDLANARVEALVLEGLVAVANDDDDVLLALAAEASIVQDLREQAVLAYDEGATMARADPDQFLNECRDGRGD